MKFRTISALLLLFATVTTAAGATWKQEVWTDRLTAEKHIDMVTSGRGSIRRFGHLVTAQLVLICTHPDDGSPNYLSLRVDFSEPVGISEAQVRYRFDNDPVEEGKFRFSDRGESLTLIANFAPDLGDALSDFRKSSELRMEVSLPWAGEPLIEFDTAGANDAIDRVPCMTR